MKNFTQWNTIQPWGWMKHLCTYVKDFQVKKRNGVVCHLLSKENLEGLTWYENSVGQKTDCELGDFKLGTGRGLSGMTLQDGF